MVAAKPIVGCIASYLHLGTLPHCLQNQKHTERTCKDQRQSSSIPENSKESQKGKENDKREGKELTGFVTGFASPPSHSPPSGQALQGASAVAVSSSARHVPVKQQWESPLVLSS